MKNPKWPWALLIIGYGLLLVSILCMTGRNLSENAHMWATIGEGFGAGLGSVGLGMLVATRRR
jgi:hypothetical protein